MNQAFFLSFSGGLDSTTLLFHLMEQHPYAHIVPVFFDYGSTHNQQEIKAARAVLEYIDSKALLDAFIIIDLKSTGIFTNNSSALLADNGLAIPTKDYKEEGSLDATVVPGRNMVMASILSSMAEAWALNNKGTATVAMGIHASDHALYPDCRHSFASCLGLTISEGTEMRVGFVAPFINKTKTAITSLGATLHVPFGLTRSCYERDEKPCGACGTCRERAKAFEEAKLVDPAVE